MNENDFSVIMNRRINMVLRLAFAYVGIFSEAEDITQDVFLKLYTSKKSFETAEAEKAWLIRVTVNRCINRKRSGWFSKNIPLTDTLRSGEFPYEEREVLDAVLRLPEKYRPVVHLFYYEDYSVKEISELMDINESTVRTRLQRARAILKTEFMEDYSDGYEKI